MNCEVVLPNVGHNPFSPSTSSVSCNNVLSLTSRSISPNVMLRFKNQLEAPSWSSSFNHQHESSIMKRKRPTKINVPLVRSCNLFNIVDLTKTCEEKLEEVEFEGDGYGVYCKRGRTRSRMEDRYSALTNTENKDSKQALFGIFDGHGGAKAAEFAATRLGQKLLEAPVEYDDHKLMKEKIRDGYLSIDSEFIGNNSNGSGTCATALIRQGKILVSNVGDCRAVISREGISEALTTDHTPFRADEKTRIEAKGGYVDNCNGVWRIQGSLAVSRAIGDGHLKEWVIAEPETKIIDIIPDNNDFLILASDGLWSKVTNQEAVDAILPYCKRGSKKWQLAPACKMLVELAITKGSSDDISVMVIQLDRFA